MEKKTPHTRLHIVKTMVRAGLAAVTNTALIGAAQMGFSSKQEIFNVILALEPADFYKSMTAYHDSTCWHEVYRPFYKGQQIYMKFIVTDGVLIVSFKEL
ncbi:type II toxin-antitoxin system MqsR family toxin [Atlantibacter sp. RC6]|uniref:type II toxin-antitoxin system MqsR family toxin n=1 Tax=Atlantibacter sp. RC6 TaxID=2587036 RepID=UPI00160565BA|nr:type II toxin-antitoxin system MqsR family toxin [Atlantibacter sp. RC6]MBB3322070.1 motility quorum-sensing regulator/GCU-specific mRNA interferase toxin [Atlantibacter sp. RC6]